MKTVSLFLPGTYNSRDLGGMTAAGGVVRSRLLIRTDAPVALGSVDRRILRDLAPAVALDLREPIERELDPADLDGIDVAVRHVPILGDEFDVRAALTLEDVYRLLIADRGAQLTSAVRTLSGPEALPAIVFCSAGKDRTGIVVALMLSALGVPDDEIVADYARSEQNMTGRFRAAVESRARAAGISEQELSAKVGSPPALMRHTLAWFREHHGGPVGYLKAHGMTDGELASLRGALVEPHAAHAA